MTDSKVNEIIEKLKNIICSLKIVDKYKRTFTTNGKRFRKVTEFRKYLFEKELEEIRQSLMHSQNNLDYIDRLISRFNEIRRSARYVACNTFAQRYKEVIDERKREESKLYHDILSKAQSIFETKIEVVRKADSVASKLGILSPRTEFMLFLASFIIAVISALVIERCDVEELEKVISGFHYDFVIAFSFVESKPHSILEFTKHKQKLKKLTESIIQLIENPLELRRRYIEIKTWLNQRGFPFDIQYPVVRRRKLFGTEFNSLILIAYRIGAIRTITELTNKGVRSEPRKLASPLYIEFAVPESHDRLLLITNFSLINKRNRIVTEIMDELLILLLGKQINTAYLRSLEPEGYSVSASVFINEIVQAIKGHSGVKIEKALKAFEKQLKDHAKRILSKEEKKSFTHRDSIEHFIDSLEIERITIEYKMGKHTLLRLEVSLSPLSNLLPGKISFEHLSKVVETVSSEYDKFRQDLSKSSNIKELVTVTLAGRLPLTGEFSKISFTSTGDIFFHNMNREYVTELSYILWEVCQKWIKQKKR